MGKIAEIVELFQPKEAGKGASSATESRAQQIKRLRSIARKHKGQKPKRLKFKNGKYRPIGEK